MDILRLANYRACSTGTWGRAFQVWSRRVEAGLQRYSSYHTKAALKAIIDFFLMLVAAGWAWKIGAVFPTPAPGVRCFVLSVGGVGLLTYLTLRLYRLPWRTVSCPDVLWLAGSALLAVPLLLALFLAGPAFWRGSAARLLPILEVQPALYLVLLGGVRIATRTFAMNSRTEPDARRLLVVGSGDAARSLVWQIQNSSTGYRVVGLVDDDPHRRKLRVLGVPVLGGSCDIPCLASRLHVHQIVIAIPSLKSERLREILAECAPAEAPVRILPPLKELMHHPIGVGSLREVRAEDLLPRAEIKLDEEAVTQYLRGRTVLVTGGGGSIGSELCRQALSIGARRLLILGRGENSVFEVQQGTARPGRRVRGGARHL